MTTHTSIIRVALALLLSATLACSGDPTAPPQRTATADLTVEAATGAAYVTLGGTAQKIVVADSGTSSVWDLGFNATKVYLNGGTVGPGGVTGYCLCPNEALDGVQVRALTANAQAPAFEAVTAANIPADTAFRATVFTDHPWYRYNLTGTDHQIWPMFHVYLIKRGSAVYKVQLTSYYNSTGAPRFITFRYARIRS
jgi:hypothetical protein